MVGGVVMGTPCSPWPVLRQAIDPPATREVEMYEDLPGCTVVRRVVPGLRWSTGMYGCREDPDNCWMTMFCPCVTFGQTAEIIDRGASSSGVTGALLVALWVLTGGQCICVYLGFYRTKLRAQYLLREEPCDDWVTAYCCPHCMLCQQYRELKNRGFDMNMGWHANMELEEGRAAAMMPPRLLSEGMTR